MSDEPRSTYQDVMTAINELRKANIKNPAWCVVFHPICIGCGVRHVDDEGEFNTHKEDCEFAIYWGLPRKGEG